MHTAKPRQDDTKFQVWNIYHSTFDRDKEYPGGAWTWLIAGMCCHTNSIQIAMELKHVQPCSRWLNINTQFNELLRFITVWSLWTISVSLSSVEWYIWLRSLEVGGLSMCECLAVDICNYFSKMLYNNTYIDKVIVVIFLFCTISYYYCYCFVCFIMKNIVAVYCAASIKRGNSLCHLFLPQKSPHRATILRAQHNTTH